MSIDAEEQRILKEKMQQIQSTVQAIEQTQTPDVQKIIYVTDSTFMKDVIEASKKQPVLVDFWAPWCGPCRMIGPTLEKLANEYNGRFVLAKLNVDENNMYASKYRVNSIPAVKLFKNGAVSDEFVGAVPEAQVRNWLNARV